MKYLCSFLFLIFMTLGCGEKQSAPKLPQGNISVYLMQVPPAIISVKENLRLRFKEAYTPLDRSNVKGITIHPKVDGTFSWADDQSLTFVPENRFDYNQTYEIRLNLAQLITSDNDLADNQLTLVTRTGPFGYDIEISQPRMMIQNDQEVMSVSGKIKSADFAEDNIVESTLNVQQKNNNDLQIKWQHLNSGKVHRFTVEGIQISEEPSEVVIRWDGGKEAPSFRGVEKITIAPAREFAIQDIQLNTENSRIISALFTRPLDQNQNLSGLIRLNDDPADINYLIDGNELKVYLEGDTKERIELSLSQRIISFKGDALAEAYSTSLVFDPIKPALRLLGQGVIVPGNSDMNFPFEAVNVHTVDLEIFQIFEDNVLQFLQYNDLNGGYDLDAVGRIIHQEKVVLSSIQNERKNEWTRYGIDLSQYLSSAPNALYKIRLGFQKSYTSFPCENEINVQVKSTEEGFETIMTYPSNYDGYEYSHTENPCYPAYYNYQRFIERNLLISNVGIVAKRGADDSYNFTTSSLDQITPLTNASINLYDYQKQLITTLQTNSDGLAKIKASREASFAVVDHPEGHAYIKMRDETANALSSFDIGGKQPMVMDGFVYTDRGVYRPGDTIYLHFMLDDTENPLHDGHPITLQWYDIKGQLRSEETVIDHVGKIYSFDIATSDTDQTGKWEARILVGNNEFSKKVRIETIKPNRLKIEIEKPDLITSSDESNQKLTLTSRWLHGAPASGLQAQIDATYSSLAPDFEDYEKFVFSDPSRQVPQGQATVYKGKLDDNGKATIPFRIDDPDLFPTMVNAQLKTRVFEKGGNFSENYASVDISPFTSYTGIRIPESRWGYKMVTVGEPSNIQLVSLNEQGRSIPNRDLSIGVYDIHWSWWYYSSERYNIYRLNGAKHEEAIWTSKVRTDEKGRAVVDLEIPEESYGRKLIRVCDEGSGHCTGDFFYMTYYGAPMDEERTSLSKLNFASDKPSYNTGENVKLSIPSEPGSKILISIEDNDEVIFQEWIEGKKDQTDYRFSVSPEMAPNVYAHVTYVQPFGKNTNDLPLRMYGVLPVNVEDANTILNPEINTSETYAPGESFEIEVSESDNKGMAYTIAIVDEGILDLTGFPTPDPHNHFYAKQSLGVKTWDLYDYVLNGFGDIDKIITVGGDSETEGAKGPKKAIRFKPVVIADGPHYIAPGTSQRHRYTMPNYVGSVRAMVVARDGNAYGHEDVAVPVKKPLMVQATLPRVVSPGERLDIPVNVFAMEDHIRNVDVALRTSERINLSAQDHQAIRFDRQGERMVYFNAEIGEDIGTATFEVAVASGQESMDQKYELPIRNPNPYQSKVEDKLLEPNETWSVTLDPVGMTGTNEGVLELSTLPPVRLDDRLSYLVRYPHGCVEQTTSALFPQLYLSDFVDLPRPISDRSNRFIRTGIDKLMRMQKASGGFGYWSSSDADINEWCTSYVGHFLIEAKNEGHFVRQSRLDRFMDYQRKRSRSFSVRGIVGSSEIRSAYLNQAYRLYTLAIADEADLPSMNVLRLDPDLPTLGKYLLAAAYAESGNEKAALDLIKNVNTQVSNYEQPGTTYGSALRDQALLAQCMITIGQRENATTIIRSMSEKLNTDTWYSTQSLSQALLALSRYYENMETGPMDVTYTMGNDNAQEIQSEKPVNLISFNPDQYSEKRIIITNRSTAPLYAKINSRGQPAPSRTLDVPVQNDHIKMEVVYKNMDGAVIDPTTIARGQDFIAETKITNLNTRGTEIKEMALTQIFPSGWEILSGRLDNQSNAVNEDPYDYRDVRDDRVYTYFDLQRTKRFVTKLNATYGGQFFLPAVICEAMYDNKIMARTKASMVNVE